MTKRTPAWLVLLALVFTGAEAAVHAVGLDGLPLPGWSKAVVVACVVGAAWLTRWEVSRYGDDDAG